MSSKYIDTSSIVQVIGCVYNNPKILDYDDKYVITEDDFDNEFHRVVFGAIYKLHELGAESINLENILDFLSSRPKSEAIFTSQKGEEWLSRVSQSCSLSSFDYYYNRMKKMTLLRMYDKYGIDVSDLYDPDNILDSKKKQKQEEWLDNSSLVSIANAVNDKIDLIKAKYVDNATEDSIQAGQGIQDLITKLKETPEVGVPMYGSLINTITRGARLRKFYLRSAPTGCGKTRTMIADACYIACDKIYDENFGWIKNGICQPTLYITTEQDKEEIQTMMLAFLSNVNEEHILNGSYIEDEEERVREAGNILLNSPLYIEELPDFSLQDVENLIKKNIRDKDVRYIIHDYVHTSLKILEEIATRSGGVKLREDNVLFMLSTRLKDICNQYGVFILSATQLNADYQLSETPDQNLLRGAKAIADKIDVGSIILPVRDNDLLKLQSILDSGVFEQPNLKLSIYKNRRGRFKGVYLWCKADLGTCRVKPIFCTGWDYTLIDIQDYRIKVLDDENDKAF